MNHSYKKTKKAFTLLEILIVVAVLGVLIAALVPRMTNSTARANDVRRKADLTEITSSLLAYYFNKGSFPDGAGGLNVISGALKSVGMIKIPTDPVKNRSFISVCNKSGSLTPVTVDKGQYAYVSVEKNGIPNAGFILMAATETEGGSNRVSNRGDANTYCGCIKEAKPITTYQKYLCSSFVRNPNYDWLTVADAQHPFVAGTCTYKSASELRYILAR